MTPRHRSVNYTDKIEARLRAGLRLAVDQERIALGVTGRFERS